MTPDTNGSELVDYDMTGDNFDTARGLVNGTALSVLLWIALIAWVVA